MASKLPDHTPRSDSEGENRALRIKRKHARRVSFADTEITSVHIFHRDDDCDTPPKPNPSSSSGAAPQQPDNEIVGFFRDLAGDSDDSGEDEGGSVAGRQSFFRPLGSPSPGGSSTAGSGASNDEDDFVGPVSSSFIRPGRLSDSVMSDDIHEETLDTTAFSMHYRSLARSESEEAKTPTAGRLVFEEKTATNDGQPSDSSRSLMALTEPKNLSSPFFIPHATGEDSNEMCIVDENPNQFNYENFSRTLDAILAESSNDLKAHSSDIVMSFNSPMGSRILNSDQNGGCQADHCNGKDSMLVFTHENSGEEVSVSHIKPSEDARNVLSNDLTTGASDSEMQNPNHLIIENGRFTEDASLEAARKTLQFDGGSQNQFTHQQSNDNPLRESSPRTGQRDFVSASDQQPVLITPKSNRGPYIVSPISKETDLHRDMPPKHVEIISNFKTPDRSYAGLSNKQGTDELIKHVESAKPMNHIESISRFTTPDRSYLVSTFSKETDLQSDMPMKHVESISKLKTPDHSYAGSSIKRGTDKLMKHVESDKPMKHAESNSRVNSGDRSYAGSSIKQVTDKLMSRLSKSSSRNSPLGSTLIQNSNVLRSTCLATLSEQFFSADPKSEENGNRDRLDVTQLNQAETPRSTNNSSKAPVSPFRLTSSGLKVREQSVTSENPKKRLLFTTVTDSVFADNQNIDPVLHVESGTLKTLQSPREKMTSNFHMGSPEKNLQPTPMLTSDSPQSRASTHSLLRKAETQNSQRKTPSHKDSWEDIMDIAAAINPTDQSPSKEPTLRSPKKALYESSHEKESTHTFSRKELSQSQTPKKLTWSPLGNNTTLSSARKERTESPSNARHNDDMLSSRSKYESSPRFIADRDDGVNMYENDSLVSPVFTKDVESARKRGSSAVTLEDGNRTSKSPRILKTSDIVDIGTNDYKLLSYQNKVCNVNDGNEADRNDKHWLNILDKFSQDPEQFLSPSVKLLNLRAMDVLEDILNCSLKPRNYEMLDSEVPQKAAENSSWRHKKRIAETSFLLRKIVHEKAKQQLMNAKHEKLLKKQDFLKSGIQECQKLKSNGQPSKIGERGVQVGECLQSRSVNLDSDNPVPSSSAEAMKHEIKVLDGEINSLSNKLQSNLKLKGEPNYADTLTSIQDHLMRRKRCRLIRQELQLWSIDGFSCQNGGCNVLLNYKDYLSQRLTLFDSNASNTISNQLNETKIQKVYPNMGALVPFAFVLNPECTRSIDVRYLGLETQVTSSLVSNLLEVVEEVQMAQIEISNLVEATFFSPSGQQLNLRLRFFELFDTGAKVNLTLDVTCLRRGTYPSEILPYEIEVPGVRRTQNSESLLEKLTCAFQNLETGYSRIMRICSCVSQLLQASAT